MTIISYNTFRITSAIESEHSEFTKAPILYLNDIYYAANFFFFADSNAEHDIGLPSEL